MILEGYSFSRTTQQVHQILPYIRTIQPSAPKSVMTESRLVQARTLIHLCPILQRVGEDAASPDQTSLFLGCSSPTLMQCGGPNGEPKGLCSQTGPLGAPIAQVMKGSPCTTNTRASLVSSPKPSQTFQYQHLREMALTVFLSPVLQVSHT